MARALYNSSNDSRNEGTYVNRLLHQYTPSVYGLIDLWCKHIGADHQHDTRLYNQICANLRRKLVLPDSKIGGSFDLKIIPFIWGWMSYIFCPDWRNNTFTVLKVLNSKQGGHSVYRFRGVCHYCLFFFLVQHEEKRYDTLNIRIQERQRLWFTCGWRLYSFLKTNTTFYHSIFLRLVIHTSCKQRSWIYVHLPNAFPRGLWHKFT